jgi:hypothetical protein
MTSASSAAVGNRPMRRRGTGRRRSRRGVRGTAGAPTSAAVAAARAGSRRPIVTPTPASTSRRAGRPAPVPRARRRSCQAPRQSDLRSRLRASGSAISVRVTIGRTSPGPSGRLRHSSTTSVDQAGYWPPHARGRPARQARQHRSAGPDRPAADQQADRDMAHDALRASRISRRRDQTDREMGLLGATSRARPRRSPPASRRRPRGGLALGARVDVVRWRGRRTLLEGIRPRASRTAQRIVGRGSTCRPSARAARVTPERGSPARIAECGRGGGRGRCRAGTTLAAGDRTVSSIAVSSARLAGCSSFT